MNDQVINALKNVYDPEIPVNIWELGLVYDIDILAHDSGFTVCIKMTMTSPTCPMADEIMEMAHNEVAKIPNVNEVKIDLIWDPPWDLSRMSDAAKLELDLMDMGW